MNLKICKKLVLFVMSILWISSVTADEPKPEDIIQKIRKAYNQEVVTGQEVEAKALQAVKKGNTAFAKGDFKKAIENYLDAISIFKSVGNGKSDVFEKKIKSCKEQIYKSYYYWARDLAVQAEKESHVTEYEKAIELCKQAIEIYPPCKKDLEKRIAKYERMKKALARKKEVAESKLIPGKAAQEYEIQVLMKQAQELFWAKQYTKAKDIYEKVLLMNPYNTVAIHQLRVTNRKIREIGTDRKYNTFKERTAEIEWKWATPIIPETVTGTKDALKAPDRRSLPITKIQEKLKSIIIDRVDFEDVTVPTAVKYLREQSKQLDPEGVGVNIFLRLAATAADKETKRTQKTAAPGGEFGEFGGAPQAQPAQADTQKDASGENGEKYPVVNLILTKKSLGEVIRFLCQAAKLKFRVEKYAVVIASENIPLDDLETKIFPVEQGSLAAIGGGEDPLALKKHFEDRGIKFPDGAKVVYDSRISRLIATNTIENLRKMEEVIQTELNAKDPMVQIQAKFVEVEQNDLKELGFNYAISSTSTSSGTANGQLEFSQNDNTLRTVGNDTLFVFNKSQNGFNFQFSVHALDQLDSKNLLSSPRITTMNGQEAVIRMVTEVYYPDDYSEAKSTTSSSSGNADSTMYTYVSGVPEFGDAKELGIMLRVTPEVDLSRRTITMRMNPTVQGLVDWTIYSYEVEGAVSTTEEIKKPVISARTIDTKVSIYDGETIVLGGIIKDTTSEILDKIPILGDLPLIGRLFQSRYTQSEKKNLLIFLTCRLVKPDGTPFFPETKLRGMPDFKRLR
jgi:general secretion pathway protein D